MKIYPNTNLLSRVFTTAEKQLAEHGDIFGRAGASLRGEIVNNALEARKLGYLPEKHAKLKPKKIVNKSSPSAVVASTLAIPSSKVSSTPAFTIDTSSITSPVSSYMRSSVYARTPPALSIPSPNVYHGSGRPLSAPGAYGFSSSMDRIIGGATIGSIYGGLYSDDENHVRGAFRGAIGGAMIGGGLSIGAPIAANYVARNKQFQTVAGSYSTNVINMATQLSHRDSRMYMMGAGSLLGGMGMAGGDRNKRRGFNQNRGTRVG